MQILSAALETFPTAALSWTVWKCCVCGNAQPVQATQKLLSLEWFGLNDTRAGRKGDSQGGDDLCTQGKEPAHIPMNSHTQTPSWAMAQGRREGMELTPAAQGETVAIPLWLTQFTFLSAHIKY